MSKEKNDSSIELKSIATAKGESQSNSISAPAIKIAFMLSACAVIMSPGSANNKITTGMKTEIVEYKDNSASTILYPFYEVLSTKNDGNTLSKKNIKETKEYGLNIYTADVISEKVIVDLGKEIAMLKNRLENSLPTHTLIYMIGSSIIGTSAAILILMRFVGGIYTIDPYFLICVLIISCTLFFTAVSSLKDWKDFLNERQ